MKISKEKQGQILSSIGLLLSRKIISYDETRFTKYVSSDYMNSQRIQSDEIYRIFEITLLHNYSGIRIVYTTTESYYGDSVDYNLIDIFIINLTHIRLEVTDVDVSKGIIFASNKIIAFDQVDRLIE